MAERHEEKYLIDYLQYTCLRDRASRVLVPDPNGESYVITSVYYDDPMNTALLEKLDGLALHTKFRLRTYDCRNDLIRLERKVKKGILTQKFSASVTQQQLPFLGMPEWDLDQFTGNARVLAAQMAASGLQPVVGVRYRRDAYLFPGTDLRLTFDTCLEALPPDPEALFGWDTPAVPVLDRNTVIMEIKYGTSIPAFVRALTAVPCKQLSVSKYALCREE